MATRMNLPYFNLLTHNFDSNGHCHLQPNNGPDSDDVPCRSRLVDFQNGTDGTAIQATYVVDNIPPGSSSCLVITQRYEFLPVFTAFGQVDLPPISSGHGCGETTGVLTCALFNPMVHYEFIPDESSNDHLEQVTIAQLHSGWSSRLMPWRRTRQLSCTITICHSLYPWSTR